MDNTELPSFVASLIVEAEDGPLCKGCRERFEPFYNSDDDPNYPGEEYCVSCRWKYKAADPKEQERRLVAIKDKVVGLEVALLQDPGLWTITGVEMSRSSAGELAFLVKRHGDGKVARVRQNMIRGKLVGWKKVSVK